MTTCATLLRLNYKNPDFSGFFCLARELLYIEGEEPYYFDGLCEKEDVYEAIKTHSRQYAKRQYTWFNNQMKVHWYDITEEGYKETLFNDLDKWLNN